MENENTESPSRNMPQNNSLLEKYPTEKPRIEPGTPRSEGEKMLPLSQATKLFKIQLDK